MIKDPNVSLKSIRNQGGQTFSLKNKAFNSLTSAGSHGFKTFFQNEP